MPKNIIVITKLVLLLIFVSMVLELGIALEGVLPLGESKLH